MLMMAFGVSATTPTIDSVSITSTNPLTNSTNEDLLGTVVSSDADSDNITEIYNWYKDGVLERTTLIENGLLAYYPLDYDGYDYHGDNDNNSFYYNTFTNSASGQKSGSLELDGYGGYLRVATTGDTLSSLTGNKTISAWVKTSDTKTYQGVVAMYGMTGQSYQFNVIGGNSFRFTVSRGSNSDWRCFSHDLTLGAWNHIVVTYDDSDTAGTNTRMYANGVDITSSCSIAGTTPYIDRSGVVIGRGSGNVQSFNGSIDEVLIYDRYLSSEEVSKLYRGQFELLEIDSSDTVTGEEWILGTKVSDNVSTSSETNSSKNIVFQRDISTNKGLIYLNGTFNGSSGSELYYSINGEEFQNLEINGDEFSKELLLDPGTYDIEVYYELDPNSKTVINTFHVGDVIVVIGQSNARLSYSTLSSYYTPESPHHLTYTRVDAYDGFVWNYGSTFSVGGYSNQWYPLIDQISKENNMPVMMISGVIGGSSIYTWDESSDNGLGGLLDQLDNLTYNREVYGIIYYQGENNAADSSYYSALYSAVDEWNDEINSESGINIIGQTWDNHILNYYPMEADIRIWSDSQSRGVRMGSYVYDMNTTDLGGTVHFLEISNEGWPFVNRWQQMGLYQFYNIGQPEIPKLTGVYQYNSTTVDMVYDRDIVIKDFKGTTGSFAYGLDLYNDTGVWTRTPKYNTQDVTDTNIINGNTVRYNFNTDISDSIEYSYCIRTQCVNKTIVRSSVGVVPELFPPIQTYSEELNSPEQYICELQPGKTFIGGKCVDGTNKIQACHSISKTVYDSFNLGVVAILVLIAALIIGVLTMGFGGGNLDMASITATITIVILSAVMFIVGIIVYAKVSGALC